MSASFKENHQSAYGGKSYFEGCSAVNFKYPGMSTSEKDKVELMVFLVDKSGSMSSNKKMQQAKDVTDQCNLTSDNAIFYTFNTQVQYVGNKDAFKQVKPSGGTEIYEALKYMFKEVKSLTGARGRSIHFVIITDAEDKMTSSQCDDLQNLYQNAVSYAESEPNPYNLSGSCLLVGNGSCKVYLERIFYGHFFHTNNETELGATVRHILKEEEIKYKFIKDEINTAIELKTVDDTRIKHIKNHMSQMEKGQHDIGELFPKINDDINKLKDATKNGDIDAKEHYKNKSDLYINNGLDKLEKLGLQPRIRDSDYDAFKKSEIETKKYEEQHYKKLPRINNANNKVKNLLTDDGLLIMLLDIPFAIQREVEDHGHDVSNDINKLSRLQKAVTNFAGKAYGAVNLGTFPHLSNRMISATNKLNKLKGEKQNISNELKNNVMLCKQQMNERLDLDVTSIPKIFEASIKHIDPILTLDFNKVIDTLLDNEVSNEIKCNIEDEKANTVRNAAQLMNALEVSEYVFDRLINNDKDSDLKRYKSQFVLNDIKRTELQNLDDDYLRDMMNINNANDRKRILEHVSNMEDNKIAEIVEPFETILKAKQGFIDNKKKIQSHLEVIQSLKKQLEKKIDTEKKENDKKLSSENEQDVDELMNALKSQETKIEMVLGKMETDQIYEKFNALIPLIKIMNKMKNINNKGMKLLNISFDRICSVHANKNLPQIDVKIEQDVKNVVQQLAAMKSIKDEDLLQCQKSLLKAKQCGFQKETAAYLETVNNQINERNKIKTMELKFQSMKDSFNNIPEYKIYYQKQQKEKQYRTEIENIRKQLAELASYDDNVYHKMTGLMEKFGNDLKWNNIILTKMYKIMESDLSKIEDKNDKRITKLIDQINQYGKALSNASKNALQAPQQLIQMKDVLVKQQFDLFVLKQKANDLYNICNEIQNDEKELVTEVKKPIGNWNKTEVGEWLESLGVPYSNYKDMFISMDICGKDLLDDSFDHEFLEHELGIKHKLKRKKLLSKINELKTNDKINDDAESADMVDID